MTTTVTPKAFAAIYQGSQLFGTGETAKQAFDEAIGNNEWLNPDLLEMLECTSDVLFVDVPVLWEIRADGIVDFVLTDEQRALIDVSEEMVRQYVQDMTKHPYNWIIREGGNAADRAVKEAIDAPAVVDDPAVLAVLTTRIFIWMLDSHPSVAKAA